MILGITLGTNYNHVHILLYVNETIMEDNNTKKIAVIDQIA